MTTTHEPQLTSREKEVLDCLTDGMNVRETAQWMGIAVSTVRAHRRNAYRTLGVHSDLQALLAWQRIGASN